MVTLEKNTVVSKAEKAMGNTAEWATSRNDINSNTDAVFPWVLPEIDGGEPIKLEAVDVEVVDDEREMVEEVEKEKLEQAENGDGERRVEAEDGFLKEIATDDHLSKVHSSKFRLFERVQLGLKLGFLIDNPGFKCQFKL